jgi:hypothetical protein
MSSCTWILVRFALSARPSGLGLKPLDNVSSPAGQRASQMLDCSDLTSRKLLFRTGIRDDVGTITRSEQSALFRRRNNADYADLLVMPTLMLDRLRGKGMRVSGSA